MNDPSVRAGQACDGRVCVAGDGRTEQLKAVPPLLNQVHETVEEDS